MQKIGRVAFVFLFGMLPCMAQAKNTLLSDPVKISQILHSIPAFKGDLGSRLASAGLHVTQIDIDPVSKQDVADDPEQWALGDVEIHVYTDSEPLSGDCQILGSPTFIKRHGKYLPQDRTGVWLLTGNCALPD